ncbi:MAG: AsmA family protein [Acidobacteriota bacterium]|nr:AsmA family protein [Acidobacteriota bacterium]
MKRIHKAVLIVVCVVVAFVIAVIIIAPRIFKVDRYRPYVVSLIREKTGRQVAIGRLGLTVFPGVSIRVDDLAIANRSGFPAGNWLTVNRVDAQLEFGALWHHRIVIRSLDLSQPVLNLLSNTKGQWNYQMPAGAQGNADPPADDPPVPPIPAAKIKGADAPVFTLREIQSVSIKEGRMQVSSVLPGGAIAPVSAEAEGIAGKFTDIDFTAAGASQPNALPASATGQLSVKTLRAIGLDAENITSPVDVSPMQVRLNDVKFDFYGGQGQSTVVINLIPQGENYTAQGSVSRVNAAQLLDSFPQMRGQLTGTLNGKYAISKSSNPSRDPWAGVEGNGTLTILRGRLPKVRLDKTLLELAHVAQIKAASGDPSAFTSIDVEWRVDRGVLTTRSVHMIGNGITVDGSGTIELNAPERLNYVGVAQLAAQTNPLTNIVADLSGASFANGKLSLPFTVGGTVHNPAFRLKGSSRGNLASPLSHPSQPQQVIQNILNLFQRKK